MARPRGNSEATRPRHRRRENLHFTVDGSSSSSSSRFLSAHNWQQHRTDFPPPCSSSRICVFRNESNEGFTKSCKAVHFPPMQNSNTCSSGILYCCSSLPIGRFHTTSRDTSNNGEMYDFWWTNKRSYTVPRDLLLSWINMAAMTSREQDPLSEKP